MLLSIWLSDRNSLLKIQLFLSENQNFKQAFDLKPRESQGTKKIKFKK